MWTKLTFTTLALAAIGSTGHAAITFVNGGGGIPITETVQFNAPGLMLSGLVVTGAGNTTGSIVQFYDAGETLQAVAAGAARVSGTDGNFTSLSIGLEDPMLAFTGIEFNLIAEATGSVTLTGHSTKGATAMATFAISKNGANRYSVIATAPDFLDFVEISADVQIGDIRQINFNAIQVVPEPGTFLALGAGVLLIAARRRKRL
jgi:hypothetical protein